jgi:hypothetical protein
MDNGLLIYRCNEWIDFLEDTYPVLDIIQEKPGYFILGPAIKQGPIKQWLDITD